MWRTSRYNFDMIQGQSLNLRFQFSSEADVPIDLTGWQATSQLADESGKLIASCTATIPSPTEGTVSVYLADEDTVNLPVTSLIWDLALEDIQGNIEKPLRGTVNVIRGATLPRATS